MSNSLNSLAGRETAHGDFTASGQSRNHQGDVVTRTCVSNSARQIIQADTVVLNEYRLFGEISWETYNSIRTARVAPRGHLPRLDTSHSFLLPSRGRDHTPRGRGCDTQRGTLHSNLSTLSSAESKPATPAASRSPSATRIPRPSFHSGSRRYSSRSRDSRSSDRFYSSCGSSIATSATTPLQEVAESFGQSHLSPVSSEPSVPHDGNKSLPLNRESADQNCPEVATSQATLSCAQCGSTVARDWSSRSPPTTSSTADACLNKPLRWIGHPLDPTLAEQHKLGLSTTSLATDGSETTAKRQGVDMELLGLDRILRLALQEVQDIRSRHVHSDQTSSDDVKSEAA